MTQAEVLELLEKNPSQKYNREEIQKITGRSTAAVQRVLSRLRMHGLCNVEPCHYEQGTHPHWVYSHKEESPLK